MSVQALQMSDINTEIPIPLLSTLLSLPNFTQRYLVVSNCTIHPQAVSMLLSCGAHPIDHIEEKETNLSIPKSTKPEMFVRAIIFAVDEDCQDMNSPALHVLDEFIVRENLNDTPVLFVKLAEIEELYRRLATRCEVRILFIFISPPFSSFIPSFALWFYSFSLYHLLK